MLRRLSKGILGNTKTPGALSGAPDEALGDSIPLSSAFLFIHIPNTAGTSFRTAAEHYFGAEHVHLDYGAGVTETSPLVQQKVYELNDLFELSLSLNQEGCKFFGGRFHIMRYGTLFPSSKIISFIRNPITQAMSHYEHLVKHEGYTKSLDEYSVDPATSPDRPHLYFTRIPLEACGFIGVTERYAESLALFNRVYGTDFTLLHENAGPIEDPDMQGARLSTTSKIFRIAQRGLNLYQKASMLLDQRIKAQIEGWNFVHGAIERMVSQSVTGFAFWSGHDMKPVMVQLWVNEELRDTTSATQLRLYLRNVNVPRNSFVGFDFSLSTPLKLGDRVKCCVVETGQVLGDMVFMPKTKDDASEE